MVLLSLPASSSFFPFVSGLFNAADELHLHSTLSIDSLKHARFNSLLPTIVPRISIPMGNNNASNDKSPFFLMHHKIMETATMCTVCSEDKKKSCNCKLVLQF